jgi:DNA-binding HxlR family transcriptional regulator
LRRRADPDVSLEDAAQFREPVHVLAYPGRTATDDIGAFFIAQLRAAGIAPANSLVLAHARRNAFRVCGSGAEEDVGTSKVARLAGAIGVLWASSTSSRGRERALRVGERMVLELMGAIAAGEGTAAAAERRNIDRRWLRRSALALLTGMLSQRMLTATVRNLERDGMLTRHVYAEVPPRVEYELTPLGRGLTEPVLGLVSWLQSNWPAIRNARDRFDARQPLTRTVARPGSSTATRA